MEQITESRVATPLFVLALIAALAGASSIGHWGATPSRHATGARLAVTEIHSTSRDRDFVARRNHLLKPGSELLAEQ